MMTEQQWIKLLADDPVYHLPIASDWFQERDDPVWMILHWLWQRSLHAEDVICYWVGTISPYVGPRWDNDYKKSWWFPRDQHYEPDNGIPDILYEEMDDERPRQYKSKEEAWHALLIACRTVYKERREELEKILLTPALSH